MGAIEIQKRYWEQIWNYEGDADYKFRTTEERILKAHKISQIKIAIVVFSMAIICLPLLGWLLDAFYWEWIGYGLIYFGVFWLLFLSPLKTIPVREEISLKEYVEEIIYEDPKHPGIFAKEYLKKMKYEWGAFIYFWMIGCCGFIYFNDNVWQNMMPYQHYWLNKLPTAIPIAIIFALGITIGFAILFGSTIAKTKFGKLKKSLFYGFILIFLIILVLMTFVHVVEIEDFLRNFKAYSIRIPEDPDDEIFLIREIYINFNALFWALGLAISSIIVVFFGLVCGSYENHIIRKAIDDVYGRILEEKVELNWQFNENKERIEQHQKKLKKIKRIAAIELIVFFGMVLFALWVLYYILGELAGNKTMMNLAIGIMGIQLLWALFFSPIFHYYYERQILYRGPNDNLGYVGLDDRGIGSWKLFWNKYRKEKPYQRTLFVINLLSIMAVLGFGITKESEVINIFGAIGLGENQIVASCSTLYFFIAIFTFIYCLNILKFPDSKDPEQGYKKLYSLLFLIFLGGLVFIGIPQVIYDDGQILADFYANFSLIDVWALLAPIIVIGILLVLINILFWPLFIKYDNLYDTIKDIILVCITGILLLTFWNWLCQIFFAVGSDYMHHSWNINENPKELIDNFHLGKFLVGVFGYHYWGWVQELLFLGYFCWLSWKIFPDPDSHHIWINSLISSILFGLFHWDNMPLMIATMIGGFIWAYLYGKRRNLWTFGLLHGFNGTLVDHLIPMSMSVGPGALS
ncbi:MAG: lysostaphin resistance A-like protein [Promethearchaeota archaeon]